MFQTSPPLEHHSLAGRKILSRDVESGGPRLGLEEPRQGPDVIADPVVHRDREQTGSGPAVLAPLNQLREVNGPGRLEAVYQLGEPLGRDFVKGKHETTGESHHEALQNAYVGHGNTPETTWI